MLATADKATLNILIQRSLHTYANLQDKFLKVAMLSAVHHICEPPPPHSYVEALTPNMTLFGDRAFREVTEVK